MELRDFGLEIEGIYQITDHYLNIDACEAGGRRVAGHPFLALYTVSFPTSSTVDAISCVDVDDCRESVDAAKQFRSVLVNFHFVFDEWVGDDSIVGTRTAGVREGEQCRQRVTEAMLARALPGPIRIEARIWHGENYTPNASDSCLGRTADLATAGQPCTQFESLNAELIDAL